MTEVRDPPALHATIEFVSYGTMQGYSYSTRLSRRGIQVRHVFLILGTNGLDHLGIDDRIFFECYAPRPSVCLRIVDRKLDHECSVSRAIDAFGYASSARDGAARRIQPLVVA